MSSKTFIKALKENKKIQLLIVFSLVLLILIIGYVYINSKNQSQVVASNDYVNSLEEKLSNVLSDVDGIGRVKVIINVESGMETVLASKVTETQSGNVTERVETPIIVNGETVVLKEMYPKIKGVLIIAEGANSIASINKLQQATISLLDININQIEILSMD